MGSDSHSSRADMELIFASATERGSSDLVLSEVCGFSGGSMGRAADLQKMQACATRSSQAMFNSD